MHVFLHNEQTLGQFFEPLQSQSHPQGIRQHKHTRSQRTNPKFTEGMR